MSRVLILYTSLTGNTEILAETIADYLKKHQHEVTLKHFEQDQITADEIKDYDATLIGIYTYDYGEIPFEVEFFFDELDEVDLTGCITGVFGAGDRFYGDTFGLAVDLMHDKLEERGATLDPERLKVDMDPEQDDIKRCEQLAERVIQKAIGKVNT
ncbi:flavodoxin domain-containing protein [Ornithinibacillus californiensis]|uniref:flavodoxin domain-containing protein n=1 Tax=Ornithinibacillus californiensis TaxID=161536 RepID=UPI00064DB372|nr:flavodoxin domain-containing protein [Ornithinibacillus californiensis]